LELGLEGPGEGMSFRRKSTKKKGDLVSCRSHLQREDLMGNLTRIATGHKGLAAAKGRIFWGRGNKGGAGEGGQSTQRGKRLSIMDSPNIRRREKKAAIPDVVEGSLGSER